MQLDSYTCEMCLPQREETLHHMFLKCSFAKKKNCWLQVGVHVPTRLRAEGATRHIKNALGVPFVMEIIIIMSRCIGKERNKWIFNDEGPSVC
jgi:hypothetical protein